MVLSPLSPTMWIALLIVLLIALGVLARAWYPRPAGPADGPGGDESALDGPARSASSLRVATFNVQGCRGLDGVRDIARIARDLQGMDIAALQEVHDSWRAPRQLDDLARRLGLVALNAPTRRRWFRPHRANALLSRCIVGRWSRMPLPGHPRQRFRYRNLTVARVEAAKPLWVLFTHLNRREGRDEQLARVMQEFTRYTPAILMGDFNAARTDPVLQEYLVRGDVTDALGENLDDDDPGRIDWIVCRGVRVERAGVIDTGASDHPLYWCDIEL